MRLGLKADNLLERLAGWFNLAPQPVAQAFYGMMASRTLMAGVRLGVYGALADGPTTVSPITTTAASGPSMHPTRSASRMPT